MKIIGLQLIGENLDRNENCNKTRIPNYHFKVPTVGGNVRNITNALPVRQVRDEKEMVAKSENSVCLFKKESIAGMQLY